MPSTAISVQFGPFVLDRGGRALHRQGELVALQPKAMDLLLVLVESAGTVVSKDELMQRVWPDTFVEEGNLPVTVFALRKALGEDGEGFIRTVPRRGYCFVGDVRLVSAPSRNVETAAFAPAPEVHDLDSAAARLPALAATHRWAMWSAAVVLLVAMAGLGYAWSRAAVAPTGPVRSMAVLPFTLVDVDTADEFLATGLAADLTRRLGDVGALAVRPVASSVKYGGEASDQFAAGRALQVDAVVTGTARRMGAIWRVSAELRRVADGTLLWSLPAAQQDLALRAVIGTIASGVVAATHTDEGAQTGVTAGTTSLEAYRSYLEGLSAGSQLTVPGVAAAVDHLERAVAADPDFADAHAALATYSLLPASTAPRRSQVAHAKAAAERALVLHPDAASAHAARGLALALVDRNWDMAGVELQQAVAVRPNDSETRLWHALYLGARGRHDDALKEIGLAVALDPTGPRANFYRGFLLLMARRYDEAISQFRQTPLELGVVTQQVAFGMAVANTKKTRYDLAQSVLQRIMTRAPSPQARVHLAFVQTEAGDRTAATATLTAALADLTPSQPRTPLVMLAAAQACLGQMDAAFGNLAVASEAGDSRIAFAAVDPALDCARADPRFVTMLKQLGLAP